jgi:hypothetical protein
MRLVQKPFKNLSIYSTKSAAAFAICISLFISACSQETINVVPASSLSKIEGRIDKLVLDQDENSFSSYENFTILLGVINASGIIEIILGSETTVNIHGRYVLESDSENFSNLVVVAKYDGTELMAFVSSKLRNDVTIYAQPLNIETTAEVKVYAEAIKQKFSRVNYPHVFGYVSSDIAESLLGSDQLVADIAAAIKTEVESELSFLISDEIGATESQIALINAAQLNAQSIRERDLHFSNNSAAKNNADEAYYEALINAFINAGISPDEQLKAVEISQRAMFNGISNIDSELSYHIRKNVLAIKAKIMTYAIQVKFHQLGGGQHILDIVMNAGAGFNASIQNASSSASIFLAFEKYHQDILDALEIAIGINSGLVTSFEQEIIESRNNLESAVSAGASIAQIISAYLQFYSEIDTLFNEFQTASADNQISIAAEIVILLNIHF